MEKVEEVDQRLGESSSTWEIRGNRKTQRRFDIRLWIERSVLFRNATDISLVEKKLGQSRGMRS